MTKKVYTGLYMLLFASKGKRKSPSWRPDVESFQNQNTKVPVV